MVGELIEAEVLDTVDDETRVETLVNFLKDVEVEPSLQRETLSCVSFKWGSITTLCVQYVVEEVTGEVISYDQTVAVLCNAARQALKVLQQRTAA
ncbi:MAG: hypothetical protein ACOC4E_03025 [Patescibacteria group bacterium]